MEQLKLLTSIAGRSVNAHDFYGKELSLYFKVDHIHILWPNNSISNFVPNRNSYTCVLRGLYKNIRSCIIHTVPSWEQPKYAQK